MRRVQAHRHDRSWVVVCSNVRSPVLVVCRGGAGYWGLQGYWSFHKELLISVEALQLPTPTSSCGPTLMLQVLFSWIHKGEPDVRVYLRACHT